MEEKSQPAAKAIENPSDSLEGSDTIVESSSSETTAPQDTTTISVKQAPGTVASPKQSPSPATSKPNPIDPPRGKGFIMLFIVIILIVVAVLFVALTHNSKPTTQASVDSQTLTSSELSQLAANNTNIGNSNQNLTIQSNATFSGSVLVKSNVSVAGTLKVGGSLNLPGISVSGTSTFGTIEANSLTVTGNQITQGTLTVQKSLTTSANGSFGGTLSAPQVVTQNLELEGDLQISHHINTIGGTPSKANGDSLGDGGTASVSGTDTAGIVAINTGSSPTSGCFISLTFVEKFGTTPHIALTPTNSAAASLQYYVTPTTTGFSVCGINPTAGQSYSFDYIAID
jgi:cytoskeletal protein CcmA (bactofilin family)